MRPVDLRTARLVLDQPRETDADAMAGYCQDPLFERFMVTPWPYEREHATGFILNAVPAGWRGDLEYNWALRDPSSGDLLGMIGWRAPIRMIGFWLGGPQRGRGLMTEATSAIADWLFARGEPLVGWECMVGNVASVGVARKAGFTFTGEGEGLIPNRDGSRARVWSAVLHAGDSRDPKPGWPAA